MTRAEAGVSALVAWLAALVAASYLLDRAGLGLAPAASAITATLLAAVTARAMGRDARPAPADAAVVVVAIAAVAAYLLWLAGPALLPLGSGPDLTHHLLLIDHLERTGGLPGGAPEAAALGEMAVYTPGLHVLAAVAAALAKSDGLHTLYPIVALSVALKVGVFVLIVLRLAGSSAARVPLAAAGLLLLGLPATYTVGSFVHDSFLAQVVSELFALALWWATLVWDDRPDGRVMAFAGLVAVAVFLTWPVWMGPALLTLGITIALRRGLDRPARVRHAALAAVPLAGVAALHAIGRASWVSILGTSGAVEQPTPATLGWGLPLVALAGLALALTDRRSRTLVIFLAALALQAAALWLVARRAGAATPYMAIKMTYLAVYPAAAAAIVGARRLASSKATIARAPSIAWAAAGLLLVATVRELPAPGDSPRIVSNDLWAAGRWARDHLPRHCVDYLVGDEYTAYWLHLAVLGNSRAASRSADNDTYLTGPSFARWITAEGPPYAIARLDRLPAEIHDEVEIRQRFGGAAVIARQSGRCE